ncbi:MAG TPA: RNA methyltransferase [Magnetospirillaceae bacterium]|nr:RNA methyltransferase [Magnetospirillaceae bacterium]
MIITSKQNPAVKALGALRRRREREQAGVTLVDGFEELSCALASGTTIQQLYVCPELMGAGEQTGRLKQLVNAGISITELSRDVFEKVAYREGADGWLAIVPALKADLAEINPPQKPLLLVCEAVEKPGNIGAMLRTADAAGADAVISVASVTDWGNPNVIRASKGAVFAVPVADTTQDALYAWLKDHNVTIVAATPDTDIPFTEPDLTGGVALFVGSEKFGLSDFWLEHADVRVRIPMVGKVNSLNVATSGALLLYEAVRQRTLQS